MHLLAEMLQQELNREERVLGSSESLLDKGRKVKLSFPMRPEDKWRKEKSEEK